MEVPWTGHESDGPRGEPSATPTMLQNGSSSFGYESLTEVSQIPSTSGVGVVVFVVFRSAMEASQVVAAVPGLPLIMLPVENGAGESQRGCGGEDGTDDVGASFNFFAASLHGVLGRDLAPVRGGEAAEREHTVSCVAEQRGDMWVGIGQHSGDRLELGVHALGAGLGEGGTDDRADHGLECLRHELEHVAHEMHPARLPAHALN